MEYINKKNIRCKNWELIVNIIMKYIQKVSILKLPISEGMKLIFDSKISLWHSDQLSKFMGIHVYRDSMWQKTQLKTHYHIIRLC